MVSHRCYSYHSWWTSHNNLVTIEFNRKFLIHPIIVHFAAFQLCPSFINAAPNNNGYIPNLYQFLAFYPSLSPTFCSNLILSYPPQIFSCLLFNHPLPIAPCNCLCSCLRTTCWCLVLRFCLSFSPIALLFPILLSLSSSFILSTIHNIPLHSIRHVFISSLRLCIRWTLPFSLCVRSSIVNKFSTCDFVICCDVVHRTISKLKWLQLSSRM